MYQNKNNFIVPVDSSAKFTFPAGTRYFIDGMVFDVIAEEKDSTSQYRRIVSSTMGDQIVELKILQDDLKNATFKILVNPLEKSDEKVSITT